MERKLYKTKICVLYKRGHCPRQSCSFAHGEAELRRFSGSFNVILRTDPSVGRLDYHSGDLRERLVSRHSPRRRRSPGFDRRGRHAFRGNARSRSPKFRSERRDKKRPRLDGQSDVSGSQKVSDGSEYNDAKASSYDHKDVVTEQLKEIQLDIKMLDDHKRQMEIVLEEKMQEAESLSSRIRELELQFDKEREDSKRIKSKLTKFIRAHHRYLRAQEDLKRTQTRLQKLGAQLSSDVLRLGANDEDLSVNVSDGEPNADNMLGLRKNLSNQVFASKRMLQINSVASGEAKSVMSKKIEMPSNGARWEKFSQPDEPIYPEKIGKVGLVFDMALGGEIISCSQEREDNHIRGRNASPKSASLAKLDDDDVEVDVEGLDVDMDQGRRDRDLENTSQWEDL